jgi:organic radical activating enzyme
MKRINDIFYSLQGEGHYVGTPAIFIRFSGCNLHCSFCDTDFSSYQKMSDADIINKVEALRKAEVTPADQMKPMIVLTGGEPSLQVDSLLIESFHALGYYVAMESNGTVDVPENLDWLTISPKENIKVKKCNELKCIFDECMEVSTRGILADYYYLQPCDTGDTLRNQDIVYNCIKYIKQHPMWRLSLQTHKLIGFK